jgi:hypothetical protein
MGGWRMDDGLMSAGRMDRIKDEWIDNCIGELIKM